MAQKGKLFLLQMGSPTATTVAKLRSVSLSISGETVDVTNKDSTGWRELLAGAGIRSASVSVNGVYTAAETRLQALAMSGEEETCRVIDEDGDYFGGDFIVTSFEKGGEYNGEITFSATLESAGVIAFTAV
jgi:TP901-1 family phage major tail protein